MVNEKFVCNIRDVYKKIGCDDICGALSKFCKSIDILEKNVLKCNLHNRAVLSKCLEEFASAEHYKWSKEYKCKWSDDEVSKLSEAHKSKLLEESKLSEESKLFFHHLIFCADRIWELSSGDENEKTESEHGAVLLMSDEEIDEFKQKFSLLSMYVPEEEGCECSRAIKDIAKEAKEIITSKVLDKFFDMQKNIILGFLSELDSLKERIDQPKNLSFHEWPSYIKDSDFSVNWAHTFESRIKYVKEKHGSIKFHFAKKEWFNPEILMKYSSSYNMTKSTEENQRAIKECSEEKGQKGHFTMFELLYLLKTKDCPKFEMDASEEITDSFLKCGNEDLIKLFRSRTTNEWPQYRDSKGCPLDK